MSSSCLLVLRPPASEVVEGKRQPAKWVVICAFLAVYVIWGSTYLGIRIAIASIPPFLMAGTRFLIAGGILYAVMRLRGAVRPTGNHWRSAFFLGGLLLMAGNGGMTWATQFVPSNLTALMIAGTPLWIILIDWLRPQGVRPSRCVFAGLLLGLTGVAIILESKSSSGQPVIDPKAALIIISATVCWAAGSVYSRHAPRPDSGLLAVAMQMMAGGVLLFLVACVRGEWGRFDWTMVSPMSLSAFWYLTLFGSLVGFTSYVWLLQVSTPAKVATYAYVNPVIALLLGRFVLGEVLPSAALFAGILILCAVVLSTLNGPRVPANR